MSSISQILINGVLIIVGVAFAWLACHMESYFFITGGIFIMPDISNLYIGFTNVVLRTSELYNVSTRCLFDGKYNKTAFAEDFKRSLNTPLFTFSPSSFK